LIPLETEVQTDPWSQDNPTEPSEERASITQIVLLYTQDRFNEISTQYSRKLLTTSDRITTQNMQNTSFTCTTNTGNETVHGLCLNREISMTGKKLRIFRINKARLYK
jgi:hypothetical protein